MPETSGVLLVDKPRGPTSHDVVAWVRRALGTRQVGHAGTLDPFASGLLVIAVGEGTKLVSYLTLERKEYDAVLVLGTETDTLDFTGTKGNVLEVSGDLRCELRRGGGPLLEAAIFAERNRCMQLPPIFSAIHVEGKRAHELARQGESVKLAERPVTVHDLRVTGTSDTPVCEVRVRLEVSKGYYVRAFARDFANQLGSFGHLSELRRTRTGVFSVEHAIPMDSETRRFVGAPTILSVTDAARACLPCTTLSDEGITKARHGKLLAAGDFTGAPPGDIKPRAWLDETGKLAAIGTYTEGVGRVTRGFDRTKT